MTYYQLPKTITVGGETYSIRTDFRAVLNVLCGLADPEVDQQCAVMLILEGMCPRWRQIPAEYLQDAIKEINVFIDCGCGEQKNGKQRSRTIDWKQDAAIIIPAVNHVAHTEIRAMPYLHWWTFFGYFMEVGESLISSVISIRRKKAAGKKLEKHEQEFYNANRKMIDLRRADIGEVAAEKAQIMKFL